MVPLKHVGGHEPPGLDAAVAVVSWTVSCALGSGRQALLKAVQSSRSGLRPARDPDLRPLWDDVLGLSHPPPECLVGAIPDWIPPTPPAGTPHSRALALAAHAMDQDGWRDTVSQAVMRWGPARVGVVVGTSASTIGATESAYRSAQVGGADGAGEVAPQHLQFHNPHGVGRFLAQTLGIQGPQLTLSTACSSSAKAFGVAQRWLRCGQADAVVVAGVEALSGSLLYGFGSLGLLSGTTCRPFDAQRSGIAVAEAAGFALLERGTGPVRLLACGEASDAHHMSAPHPQGLGARLALQQALQAAGRPAADVDYVNLHATGTLNNDAMEALVLDAIYGDAVHASATKGMTGHAMGAAGVLEAALCFLALEDGLLSASPGLQQIDPSFPARTSMMLKAHVQRRRAKLAVSHSFGFGGSNAVLVFEAAGGAP